MQIDGNFKGVLLIVHCNSALFGLVGNIMNCAQGEEPYRDGKIVKEIWKGDDVSPSNVLFPMRFDFHFQ